MTKGKKITLAVAIVVIIALLVVAGVTGGANGTVNCPECGGDPSFLVGCEECGGEGAVRGTLWALLPPVIAIGHHGHSGYATVTGFEISGNVFDSPKFAAIRYTNIRDVEITNNKFIATEEYKTVDADGANRPALIVFYNAGASMSTYKSTVNGTTVTIPTYQSGLHNIKIENNTFDIEGGTDKRLLEVNMEYNRVGAAYVSNIMIADTFDARPTRFSGYVEKANTLSDISFSGNTINITGQPTYSNQFFSAMNTSGFVIENNTVNIADGVNFTSASDGMTGFNVKLNRTGADAYSRFVEMVKSNSHVSVCDADGNEIFKVTASANALLELASDGNGSIELSFEGGNVIATVTPKEGYTFDGWYNGDAKATGDASIGGNTVFTAKFAAK